MTASGQKGWLREGEHWLVDPVTGCWEWQKFKLRGYARTGSGQAHRAVWRQSGRPLRDEDDLHHACENVGCVNPDHMQPLERPPHLIQHKRADSPLIAAQIVEIRSSTASGRELAMQYGVSLAAMSDILSGRNWRGIGPDRPSVRCGFCGASITAGYRSRRYCNAAHRQAAYMQRRAAA